MKLDENGNPIADNATVDAVLAEVKKGNLQFAEAEKKLQTQIEEVKKGTIGEKERAVIAGLQGTIDEIKSLQERTDAIELAFKRAASFGGKEVKAEDVNRTAYDKKFVSFVKGEVSKGDMLDLETKTLQTNIDKEGGALVSSFVEAEILRVARNTVSFRGLCSVKSLNKARSYKRRVNQGGSTCRWEVEGEQNTGNTATPTISRLEIVPGKMVAKPLVTEEMLDDSEENIERMLVDETAISFSDKESAAFISGDGIEKPRGLLTYPTVANSSWTWGSIGYVITGVSGDLAAINGGTGVSPADIFIDLIAALPNQYLANASFIMNKATIAKVRKIKDTTANFIWQDSTQKGSPALLFGYPVIEVSDMPDIAANSFSVAFGDFRAAYIIVDKSGTRVIRDETTKKPDYEFCFTRRVGGGVHMFDAVKFLKFGTS